MHHVTGAAGSTVGGRHGGRFFDGGLDGEFAGLVSVLAELRSLEVDVLDAVGTRGQDGGEQSFEAGYVAEGNRDRFMDSVVVDQVAFVGVSFLVDGVDFDEVGWDVGGGDGLVVAGFCDGQGGLRVSTPTEMTTRSGATLISASPETVRRLSMGWAKSGRDKKRSAIRMGTVYWIMIRRYALRDCYRFDIGGRLGCRAWPVSESVVEAYRVSGR